MTVTSLTSGASPDADVAVLVHKSPVGAHVGLLYRTHRGAAHQLLHQAWHWDTRSEPASDYAKDCETPVWWVRLGLDPFELAELRTQAALVASKLPETGIPYAFERRDAAFLKDGSLSLGSSKGLTCATFVMLVFESVRIPLVDDASWDRDRSPARIGEDTIDRQKLLKYLRDTGRQEARDHASNLEAEVSSPRVRAEEVAAASGMPDRPVVFTSAEPAGREILSRVNASTGLMAAPDAD